MVGVQAGNATAEDRERVALLMRGPITDQAQGILLSTCHRVELYGFGSSPRLRGDMRVETGAGAVQHLIRVAAGLESAIVGEDEVLHQVRQALALARASGSVDSRLGRLFETAISAGRRARAHRTVASGNLAQRAVAWLQQKTTIAGRAVLIVGAGRMGSALAHAAKVAGSDVTVASRSATRARRLARVYRGRGVDLATASRLRWPASGISSSLSKPLSRRSRTSRPRLRCPCRSGHASTVPFLASMTCTPVRRRCPMTTSIAQSRSSTSRHASSSRGWKPASERPPRDSSSGRRAERVI